MCRLYVFKFGSDLVNSDSIFAQTRPTLTQFWLNLTQTQLLYVNGCTAYAHFLIWAILNRFWLNLARFWPDSAHNWPDLAEFWFNLTQICPNLAQIQLLYVNGCAAYARFQIGGVFLSIWA